MEIYLRIRTPISHKLILKKRTEKIVRKILRIAPELKNSKNLDIGCGDCLITSRLPNTIGIDIYDQRKVKHKDFLSYDGKKIPFPDDSFDILLILFTLHHSKDPINLIQEAKRVGKKIIIFEDTFQNEFQYKFLCFYDSFTNRFLSKYKVMDLHNNFKKDSEWKSIFKKLNMGLTTESHRKYWFFPFTYSMYVLEV